jgi:Cytochrome P450
MSVTKDPSAGVPLRPGFDHQTNPDLLSGSFGGWSKLRAEGRAFRSDIAGSHVVLPTASAGRDENQYPDPDEFRLDRFPNPHLAFGAGPHRCAGAHLARQELRIALEEWHRRIPDYELADREPISEYVGAVAGLTALPLRWPISPAVTPRGGHDD